MSIAAALAAVMCLPAAAWATPDAQAQCEANYRQDGSYFAGRTFSSWGVHPAKAPAATFRSLQVGFAKSGLKVVNVDKDLMMLTAEQASMSDGKPMALTFTVLVEPAGKGSKVTSTIKSPPTKALSADAVRASVCAVIRDSGA
jgi:hypothetical protein